MSSRSNDKMNNLGSVIDHPAKQARAAPRLHRPARIKSSKEKLRIQLYAALLAIDVGSIIAGFTLANFLRLGDPLARSGLDLVIAIVPIFVALAFSKQAYSLLALNSPRQGMFKVAHSFFIAAAAVIGVLFYAKASAEFSRLVFAIGTMSSSIMISSRYLLGQWAGRRAKWNFINEVILVDGTSIFPSRG